MAGKQPKTPDEYVIGNIENVEHGTDKNGDSYWRITANGQKMSTWDAPLLTKLAVGSTVRLGVTRNGQYINIVSVDSLGDVTPEKVDEPAPARPVSGAAQQPRPATNSTDDSILRQKALMEARLLLADMMGAGLLQPNGLDDAIDLVVSTAKAFYSRALKG